MQRVNNENRKSLSYLFFIVFVLFAVHSVVYSQTALMKANRVWCGIVETGGRGSFNYGSGWFPADYNAIGPSMENGNSMTGSLIVTGTTNWLDPDGVVRPKGVTQPEDGYIVTISSSLENYVRWGYPELINDFETVTLTDWGDENPGAMVGTSDQTAEVTTINAMGVEIKRRIFAWSQQFHDNYIIVEAILTNKSGTTLNDFYVSLAESPNYMRKAKGSNPSVPSADRVGVNRNACWHHYYGARPGDSLRIHYMYNADDTQTPGDQMGGPVASQDGRLMESDIAFYGILHASAAPYTDIANDVDDPLQPRVTDVYADPAQGTEALWGAKTGRDLIYDLMAGKHGMDQPMPGQYANTFHRANNDEQNDPDWATLGEGFNKSAVWNKSVSSFGPYTFANGQSIRIVYASGYTGIGIEMEKVVGEQWKNGTLQDPPNLPNAETGYFPDEFAFPSDATTMDKIKDRWISTGIDTVHKTISRAKWNFEHNWNIPQAPAPPSVDILGTGEGVEITWSPTDLTNEADPNFVGYRISKRIGEEDTTFFEVVLDTLPMVTGGPYTYVDKSVLFGATYYYYVQTGVRIANNDPNAYPGNQGKILWSSRLWIPTHEEVTPKRPADNQLSKIRIVPNPYNIKDDLFEGYQFRTERQGIQFYNLPAIVTIKIYTESGDLVRSINHNPPAGDGLEVWDMLSTNQQVVASGVYIAVFQKPNGETAFQKFIIVR